MKKQTIWIIVGIAILFLIGFIYSNYKAEKEETIKIGGAFGLTGAASEWGIEELNVVKMVIDDVNFNGGIDGKKIELIVEDTKTESKDTLNAVKKLIEVDNVQVIIGPTWGDSFGELVGPVGEEAKVVQLTPSGALEVAEQKYDFKYFFSTWYPQLPEVEEHIKFLKSKNLTRISIMHDQDPFNTLFADMYKEEVEKNNFTVTDVLIIKTDEKDYRTVLIKAKQKNPEVMLINIFEVGNLGSVLKNMKELNMNTLILATSSGQTQDLLDSYADIAEGKMYFSNPDLSSDRYRKFLDRYKKKYGNEPKGASAAPTYDAINALIQVLKNGARNGEEIRNELNKVEVPGILVDKIKFNEKGQISDVPFLMTAVKNKTFVEVFR